MQCPACNENFYYYGELNKHLLSCPLYDTWLETYKPPATSLCTICDRNFTLEHFYEHSINCASSHISY